MAELDHWHPVLMSRELKPGKSVGITLAGKEIALFRPGPGKVAAIDDKCVHRRMRLSLGKVVNERLECVYHGWTFDDKGQGESPGTPKLYACALSYDVREWHDVIWVKNRGPDKPMPELDRAGQHYMGVLTHHFPAPIELVMDAFSEIEHTGFVHGTFGVDPKRNHECQVTYEPEDDNVTVRNRGPSKLPGSWLIRRLMFYKPWMWFYSDYTFRYDPPRVVIDHWWADPNDPKREAMMKYRVHQFFVPINGQESNLVTFVYGIARYPLPLGGGIGITRPLVMSETHKEIEADVWLCKNLVDKSPTLEGMKLSRFDRTMGLNRERLKRLYYGSGDTTALSMDRIMEKQQRL
jgi:phenylpropionate dioxygenase-like ring-hydroxylating dioxygenase large terminal subunit